ncbi:MAG: alpha/beta hydrolase [Myxococcota bacterium]
MKHAPVLLRHAKVELALHTLRQSSGPNLLLLHGLGEHSPDTLPQELGEWPGSVFALDFTGHGQSSLPRGGGYSAELLMADADAALAHLGRATLLGRGLGAYVALLLAGARPADVAGAILCDGPGLSGGGPQPSSPTVLQVDPEDERLGTAPDPFALLELARDPRPADYATSYIRQSISLSGLEQPITVCARERPPWLQAVAEEPGVAESTLRVSLELCALSV